MNPNSIFKDKLLSKSLSNKKKFIINDDTIENNIIIEAPKIKDNKQKQADSTKINYYLDNLNQQVEVNKNDIVHICIFTVQTNNNPYLLYLLYKHLNNDVLTFPYFYYNDGDLLYNCNQKMESIIDINYEFKGYKKKDNNIYAFYRIENNVYTPELIKKNDDWWFSLIYEICYQKKINNYKIHNSVTDVFINNMFLTLLYDDNNIPHEVPIPLYVGSHKNNLDYLLSFGAYKSLSPESINGQFYYYSDYDSACRFGLWTNDFKKNEPYTDNEYGRYIEGGLVRYTVFVGNTKVNLENSKKENNNDDWTIDYDSIFIGNVNIDNMVHLGYNYTIKDNSRIDPLSFHYLDKSNIGLMYDPKKKYEIL